jgi:acyl-CoA synthetase (NDP forming)
MSTFRLKNLLSPRSFALVGASPRQGSVGQAILRDIHKTKFKAARIKPVVVVKSGRRAQGAKAAATHPGALAGSDVVYDAALARRHGWYGFLSQPFALVQIRAPVHRS